MSHEALHQEVQEVQNVQAGGPSIAVGAWRGLRWPDSDVISLACRSGAERAGNAVVIGCGNGRHVRALCELGWNACGVEPDPTMLESARANGVTVHAMTLEHFSGSAIAEALQPSLVLAWGILMMDIVDRPIERIAALDSEWVIANWRSEANSFLSSTREPVVFGDDGIARIEIEKAGHHLDGVKYLITREDACHLPGYERTILRHLTLRDDTSGETNAWYQTAHRKVR